jgi:phosphoribosylglycinamide formyltransferase-1
MNQPAKPSVTVLISGRGSNLKALINSLNQSDPGQNQYRIGAVISNKADALGLKFAEEAGIPTHVVERSQYPSLTSFKDAVLEVTLATNPTLVALAGFMVVLHPAFTEALRGRLINIHPSLLPLFPGLDTHTRVLREPGVTHHGVTVHFVDSGVDTGPRIAQAAFAIQSGDTPETLAARALTFEHRIYPWVLSHLASGDILLHGDSVRYSTKATEEAQHRGFTIF